MFWSTNTQTIFRCIAKAASSSATGSTLTVQRWPTGLVNPQRCWNRWPMPLAAMCWLDRRSLHPLMVCMQTTAGQWMTRRSRCSPPEPAKQRLRDCGPMAGTRDHGAAAFHPPAGISSRQIAKGSTQRTISQNIRAGCTPPRGRLRHTKGVLSARRNRLPGNERLCWPKMRQAGPGLVLLAYEFRPVFDFLLILPG